MQDLDTLLARLEQSLATSQAALERGNLVEATERLTALLRDVVATVELFTTPHCSSAQDDQHTDIGNEAQYLLALRFIRAGNRVDSAIILDHLQKAYEAQGGSERAADLNAKVVAQLAELR